MQLIDTHQHLILRGQLRYGWTETLPALAGRDFAPADYAAQVAGRGVIGSIYMESGVDDADYQTEARLVAELPGFLGQIVSCRPEVDAGFDAWLEACAGLGVLGFRRILHVMPDALSQAEVFRRNLRKIGAKGLPFDLCVLARQLGIAEDLIRACPEQRFVLNHCGNPDIAAGEFDTWAHSLRRLSRYDGVYAKLSGITANCGDKPVTAALLRPFVQHVIDCFGPARIVWGSDWPVVNINADLTRWFDLSEALLSGLSADERDQIGAGIARKVYGM